MNTAMDERAARTDKTARICGDMRGRKEDPIVSTTRPTLKDIAAYLNLTHPTVSRALAGHASISADTRVRVREAAAKLGYVANSSARMLKRGQSDVVGLLLPDITNEFYAAVAKRLADDCGARQQPLLLSITSDDPERELALVRALLEARPVAIVAALSRSPLPETIALLGQVRCVQFMQRDERLDGPWVSVEASGGARMAMDHLLDLGHRRIGFVGPSPDYAIGQARLRGVSEAYGARGISPDDTLMRLGPADGQFAQAAVEAMLDLPAPPTALYLSSAPISMCGMRAISRRGLSVPDDISVIVAGNAAWYDVWPSGLTSISLPMARLADAASALVADAGLGGDTILAFELVERGSTAPFRVG